jgi:release factor glutamine methyltransferase
MPYESRITNHELPITDIRSALCDAIALLERNHVPSAALAAELLLMHTLGQDRAWLYAHPEHELGAAAREKYFALVARRASGVPTQHLTGHQEFWGLDLEVTPDVLIPRPETEHVIEVSLQRLGVSDAGKVSGEGVAPYHNSHSAAGNTTPRRPAEFRIADVGTGSGCIAIALAYELPAAQIVATDISVPALEVARRNASRHNVASRINFIECSLLESLFHESRITNHPSIHTAGLRASESRSYDLIASNPPYIGRHEAPALAREVRDHEPESALYGGETGAELYAPLIAQAAKLLKPGGILVLELGHNSAEEVARLLATFEWVDVILTKDLAGILRVASARRLQ